MHIYLRRCFRCHWCRNLAAVNCILHWIILTLSTLQILHCSLYWNFISSSPHRNVILRLSCRLSIHQRNHLNLFFSSYLSTENRSTLPSLSLVMVFLGNVFTNFIFQKRISREALVTGRVTATSNNKRSLWSSYKWKKLFERYRQLQILPFHLTLKCTKDQSSHFSTVF